MAAKVNASNAFNAYFMQQQGHAPLAHAAPNNEPAVHDLHLKMSKKIAQLTKVVYALNSKNDEAENLISNLKMQFEDEKEQLFLETSKKMEELKVQIYNKNDNSKTIGELEGKLKDFQNQRSKALDDLEVFKIKTLENESQQSADHRNEFIEMTKLVESLKREQQKQNDKFESLISKLTSENENKIEQINSKHKEELLNLKSTSMTRSKTDMNDQLLKLQAEHEKEVSNLQNDMANLLEKFNQENENNEQNIEKLKGTHEKEILKVKNDFDEQVTKADQDKNDYEQSIQKLKLFHERELEARSQNSNNEYLELIDNLKGDLTALNKEKALGEIELNKRYHDALNQVGIKEEEIEILKEKLNEMRSRLENNDSNSNKLNDEIIRLTEEIQGLQVKQTELEFENSSFKNRFEFQSKNLLERSNEISQLEAANLQKTSMISDIQHELTTAKTRLQAIEAERRELENESLTNNDRNTIMIRSLENQLKTLTEESSTQRSSFETKIESMGANHNATLNQIKVDFDLEKQGLIDNYENKINSEQMFFNEKILNLEVNLNKTFTAENQKLLNEKNELKERLELNETEFKTNKSALDTDLFNTIDLLKKTEIELKELTVQHDNVTVEKVRLNESNAGLSEISTKQVAEIAYLTTELNELKFLHETSTQDSQVELKCKLDMLNKELNGKWQDRLKNELDALRDELQRSMEAKKREEIDMLNELKDNELKSLKNVWQTKTNELLDEISQLKRDLSEKEESIAQKFELFKASLESENRSLVEQIEQLNSEHSSKMEKIKMLNDNATSSLLDNLMKENQEKIANMKQMHLEDMKAQTIAQKSALATFKSSLENSKKHEIELLNQSHLNEIEQAKQDVEQTYFIEIDNLKQQNEQEILTLRVELERAVEINQQKEKEFEIKHDEYQQEMRLKQKLIEKFTEELGQMKTLNNDLTVQTETKMKELKRVKHELQVDFKNKESLLQQRIEDEINHLNLENTKQKQLLVNEFKHAQDILKEKIYETEEALRQMHERYLNRESRDEDLEQIQSLKDALEQREELLRKMNEEKKYFQMELVNRDTNFNKVFNNNVNVGCINPLTANTKIKKKGGVGNTSSMSFANSQSNFKVMNSPQLTKLDPISGVDSPLHDFKLNPNKPLPKKFLI